MADYGQTDALARLEHLLAAYGATPARWPTAERDAALRLLERSAAARALRDEAAELDRLLDAVPSDPPSAALARRVLAAAPTRRVARVWRRTLAAAVPLAAAAAVALWLTTREPVPTAPTSLALGEYTSPTDVLLEPYGPDVYATVPSIGCADSVLGCPDVPTAEPYSERRASGRARA